MTPIINTTNKFYKEKLTEAFKTALIKCKVCKIPYGDVLVLTVNTRAKSRWGLCKKIPHGWEIEISDRLLVKDVSEYALMDTLLHEILHTCKGCQNHGKLWKEYAKRLNNKFCYNIKRCTSAEEKGLDTRRINTAKYRITCTRCGCENLYLRRSRVVQLIEAKPISSRCSCGRCGSHNFKFEVL